ncbi:P-loop containing nucleoside triphosphate hydrolase protein, partial [Baffinella frigidus]
GLLSPWKGVLLYGPPGTGKTMLAKAVATECKTTFFNISASSIVSKERTGKTLLAKAVATECKTTFFNISASSIVSKWRGDSEKLVRVLFELARYHKPSTIFLDEIDAIMSQRLSAGQEQDGSRRMKTELLIQLDGVISSDDQLLVQLDGVISSDDQVFLLCASNLPWDLDSALLRRLEKRIFVPLPGPGAREAIASKHLTPDRAPGVDCAAVSARTEGFSGSDMVLLCKEAAMRFSESDMVLLCKEAAMRPIRWIMKQLEATDGEHAGSKVRLGPMTEQDALVS